MYLCCCSWRHKTCSAILCFDLIEIDVLIRFVSNYTRVHVFSIYCSESTHASTITKFLLNFLLHSRLGHVCQSCLFTRGEVLYPFQWTKWRRKLNCYSSRFLAMPKAGRFCPADKCLRLCLVSSTQLLFAFFCCRGAWISV